MTSLSAKKIIKLFSLRSADIHLEVNRKQNAKLNEEKDESYPCCDRNYCYYLSRAVRIFLVILLTNPVLIELSLFSKDCACPRFSAGCGELLINC